jgi:hypothetical protein
MRFFKLACFFGLVVASIGCVTDNFGRNSKTTSADGYQESDDENSTRQADRRKPSGVRPTGVEPKAREIERSLGIY